MQDLHSAYPPGETAGHLEELLRAVEDAMAALIAWDLPRFEDAAQRQAALCHQLAQCQGLSEPSPVARTLHERMAIYRRLLAHSSQLAKTMQIVLHATGDRMPLRSSVHFKG